MLTIIETVHKGHTDRRHFDMDGRFYFVSEQRNILCYCPKLMDQFLLVNQAISETLVTKTLYNHVPRFSINLWSQPSWRRCMRRLWSFSYPCYSYNLLNGCACVIYCTQSIMPHSAFLLIRLINNSSSLKKGKI